MFSCVLKPIIQFKTSFGHPRPLLQPLRGHLGRPPRLKSAKFNSKVNMGIISYVLRCSEAEYSSYNQFQFSTASTTAILRSSGTTSEAKKCKVDWNINMSNEYQFLCSKVFWTPPPHEYSGKNQFRSSTASIAAIYEIISRLWELLRKFDLHPNKRSSRGTPYDIMLQKCLFFNVKTCFYL